MVTKAPEFGDAELDFEKKNWNKALSDFQAKYKEKKKIIEFLKSQSSPQEARAYAVNAQGKADKRYASGLGRVLAKIDAFANAGDVAMKAAPESVGLAWMAVRMCLHSWQDDFNVFELFSGACVDMIGIMLSCRVYGKMWGGRKGPDDFQELHSRVVDYIPGIYANILEFSYRMKIHMDENAGFRIFKGLFRSAMSKFEPVINGIRDSEKTMSGFASKAADQLQIHYQETGLQHDAEMMTEITDIKKTLQAGLRDMRKKSPLDKAKEQYEEQVKRLNAPVDPTVILKKNLARRSPGTCEWIFELSQYNDWLDSAEGRLLWISGEGGLGKSIVTSAVIDKLYGQFAPNSGTTLQYLFCASGDDATRESDRIRRHLLRELYNCFGMQDDLSVLERGNDIISKFLGEKAAASKASTQKRSDKSTSFAESYLSLASALETKVLLVIDALDECSDRVQGRLIPSLEELFDGHGDTVKVMITSRPEADIGNALSSRPEIKVNEHNGPDIEKTAKAKLGTLSGLSAPERDLACKAIVEKAQGLYRCVDPAIDFLSKPWQRPIERRLAQLPEGLTDSYLQILRQVDSDYLPLLETSLIWCLFTGVEPSVAEIMDDYTRVYNVEDMLETEEEDLDNPYDHMKDKQIHEQIMRAGGGTFIEARALDDRVSVRHNTVREFFLKLDERSLDETHNMNHDSTCPTCRSKAMANERPLVISPKKAHLHLALTCLRHLNSPLFLKRYHVTSSEHADQSVDKEDPEKQSPQFEDVAASNDTQVTPGSDDLPAIESQSKIDPSDVASESADDVVQKAETDLDSSRGSSEESNMSSQPTAATTPPATEEEKGDDVEAQAESGANEVVDDDAADFFAAQDEADGASSAPASTGYGDESNFRPRYELTHWQVHLKEAEALWLAEERKNDPIWQEVYDLAIKFLQTGSAPYQMWFERFFVDNNVRYFDEIPQFNSLQIAACFGITGLVEQLLARGASATEETSDGRQPLFFAISADLVLLRALLDKGAQPNLDTSQSFGPPFYELLMKCPEIDRVRLFLEYGADPTIPDDLNANGAHYFTYSGKDPDVLSLLVEKGTDVNARDKWGETPLHNLLHVSDPSLDVLHALIKHGADVNIEDNESQRPLYEVALSGNVEAARLLLDHGVDINDKDKSGATALHAAAWRGHGDMVTLLLEKKVDICHKDKRSRSALFLACQQGNVDCVRSLLAAEKEIGQHSIADPMDDGRTALSRAAGGGHVDVVKLLLSEIKEGAIDQTNGADSRTALQYAVLNGKKEVVDTLLTEGASATVEDKDGRTALTLCGERWSLNRSGDWPAMILRLVEYDKETPSKDGGLLAVATIKGDVSVITALLEAKAHPNRQDEHGWTPLQLARQYDNKEVANLLSRRATGVGSRPHRWTTDLERIQISEDGLDLTYIDRENVTRTTILANHPIPAGVEHYYFEVELGPDEDEDEPWVAVGFATKPPRVDKMLGWHSAAGPSWGWHSDDGNIYANSNFSERTFGGGSHSRGDVIGCGIIYKDGVEGVLFYTRNGVAQGPAALGIKGRLYPAVAMTATSRLLTNMGMDLQNKPFKWAKANEDNFVMEDCIDPGQKLDINFYTEDEVAQLEKLMPEVMAKVRITDLAVQPPN